jgi:hypothetical protein
MSNVKLYLILLILFYTLFINGCFLPQAYAQTGKLSLPWLKTVGNQIVTEDTNQPVLLQGANVMRSEWAWKNSVPFDMTWENKVIPEMVINWKGNVIVRGFASDPVNNDNIDYLRMLDQHVSLAQTYNIYIVFVWRSDTIDGLQPNRPDASAESALVKLATRYHGISNVVYGLQVEPHGVDWLSLRPQFETMVDAIRLASVPYVPIIMVPGANYSKSVASAITDPVKRVNIVYKPHGYYASAESQTNFGSAYDAGLPIFIAEFGPTGSATMDDTIALLKFTRDRGIGWAAWWLDYANPGTEALVDQINLSPTDPWGITAKNEMLTTPTIPRIRCLPIGDIDCQGQVNTLDFSIMLMDFGTPNSRSDLDDTGYVDMQDLLILLGNFGTVFTP